MQRQYACACIQLMKLVRRISIVGLVLRCPTSRQGIGVAGAEVRSWRPATRLLVMGAESRTGFEETKDFPIEINGVIAGRYQVV